MLRRPLPLIAILCFWSTILAFGTPGVHFGPTPSWVVKVAPNEQRPNLRDVNDGYYLFLYERELNVALDEEYVHTIKEIISDAGIQGASNISINFNPDYERLTVHQITIWRDGQPLDKLQKDGFKVLANEQELSRYLYNGNNSAYLILKDIRKGDRIECAYTIAGSNPILNKKFDNSFTFQSTDPISQLHYYIVAPATRNFSFKYFNNGSQAVVTKGPGVVTYDWQLNNLKGLEFNDNTPGWYNPFPHVQISEYKSWGEVVEWANSINQPAAKLSGDVAAKLAKLKEKYGTDSTGLFREIVAIVQNEVRYMGVEIGVYSHKANKPERVYEQRYGDCKDKSLLMVSMLRSVGIQAHMALANTSKRDKVTEDLPSPGSFNHAIVVAHFGGRDVWIDATISYQGGSGTTYYCPNYGKALVLSPGNTSLTTIPTASAGEIKYLEEYDITDEHEPVTLSVYTTYTGGRADENRSTFATTARNELEKSYLEYYSKFFSKIESDDTLTIIDNKSDNTLKTYERYKLSDFFELDSVNNNYPISFYSRMIRNQLPAVPVKKNSPIAVNFPYDISYSIHVKAPINWNIANSSETIVRAAYRFSRTVTTENDMLIIDYNFGFLKDHIAADELAQYDKDSKKLINDYLSYSITYSNNTVSVAKGTNYWAVLLFVVLVALCYKAGTYIYKLPTHRLRSAQHEPRAIGGWLILPILGLILSSGRGAYYLFSTGFFDQAIWHVYDHQPEHIQFNILLWIEFVYNTVLICYALFCLVLIYNKRDILPKLIKILFVGSLVVVTIDSIWAYLLFPTKEFDSKDIYKSIVAVCIWIPYFNISRQVKDTFIVPYPDYGYESPTYNSAVADSSDTQDPPQKMALAEAPVVPDEPIEPSSPENI